MSVREAQARISSREFAEWAAFYTLEAEESDPDREPSPEVLNAKMEAFAAAFGGSRVGERTMEHR